MTTHGQSAPPAAGRDAVLALAHRTADEHQCHVVILYGSWARGEATATSDVDLLCVRDDGPIIRDARLVDGLLLDAFVTTERALDEPDPSLLRLAGGIVVRDRGDFGRRLLESLERRLREGPGPLPPAERQLRVVWGRKMLDRIATTSGPESDHRRMSLLVQSLEDALALMGRWYRGAADALGWLQEHEPATHVAFVRAYRSEARDADVADLVRLVYGRADT